SSAELSTEILKRLEATAKSETLYVTMAFALPTFDSPEDFKGCKVVSTLEHPRCLDHHHDGDEPGIFVCQPPLNDFRCLYRLNRIILWEVADQDVRVEADHRRAVRFETPTAASAAASVISAIVTGRLRLDLRMPRKAAAGSFGSQNNATIGVDKELNPIGQVSIEDARE